MDMRIFEDRRRKPTPIFSRYTLFGRRSSFRRTEDQLKGGYVDRYGLELLCVLLLIAGLNVLDAFFTITIMESGGQEVNPIVLWAIDTFGHSAWYLKFTIVSCCAVLLCLHCHFRMVKASILFVVILYSGVVMYQLMLLRYLTM